MALALRSVAESGGANHRGQILQRALQVIIDNNIVEFGQMAYLFAGGGNTPGDRFGAVGRARGEMA